VNLLDTNRQPPWPDEVRSVGPIVDFSQYWNPGYAKSRVDLLTIGN